MEVILLIVAAFVAILVFAINIDDKKHKSEKQKVEKLTQTVEHIESIILPHARTLAIKWDQLPYKDDYGNYIFDDWDREVEYFITSVLLQDDVARQFLNSGNFDVDNQRLATVREMVSDIAHKETERMLDAASDEYLDVDTLTGEEYERYCASLLNKHGWDANPTTATGDQGIDIIGKINGITAVFQCKRYSQPVGNAAVQEVIAGKTFAQAQYAAVVSNSTFTKSARQLADTANVYLLHHSELEEFAEMILPK